MKICEHCRQPIKGQGYKLLLSKLPLQYAHVHWQNDDGRQCLKEYCKKLENRLRGYWSSQRSEVA